MSRHKHIIVYLKELVRFVKENEKAETQYRLIILDNISIHQSEVVKVYLENEKFSVAYISQYIPELVTIERYFSK